MTWTDAAALMAGLGGLLAGFAILAQVRQRKMTLAQTYIGRFWLLDDEMRAKTSRGTDDDFAVQQYRRLCEDEFEVARQGWIDGKVWAVWHDAIADNARADADLPDQTGFEYLKQCASGAAGHDMRRCPALGDVGPRRKLVWLWERHV